MLLDGWTDDQPTFLTRRDPMMQQPTRRQILSAFGAGAATLTLAPGLVLGQAAPEGFKLPPLPYPVDALEPHIDAKTMEIHHDRHHKAYVDNLNKALDGETALLKMSVVQILREIDKVPEAKRQAVINNGGGHSNHTLFWEMMAPKVGGKPTGELAKAIDKAFGSFDKFQTLFAAAGTGRFGSGWAWLIHSGGKLEILSTGNQDSPYLKGQVPLLGLDVWEHAYYLKYQNKRADYIAAWWNVVNWPFVAERLAAATKGA
jgi:Fe-Mn family superoxide dismutase